MKTPLPEKPLCMKENFFFSQPRLSLGVFQVIMAEPALLAREHVLPWVEKIEYKDGNDDHTIYSALSLISIFTSF